MELGPIVRDASQLRKKLTEGLSRKECMGLARDLLNGEPHCFHGSTSHFDSVRQYLAEALGVDEDDVAAYEFYRSKMYTTPQLRYHYRNESNG